VLRQFGELDAGLVHRLDLVPIDAD
jgi:hypothetical protein